MIGGGLMVAGRRSPRGTLSSGDLGGVGGDLGTWVGVDADLRSVTSFIYDGFSWLPRVVRVEATITSANVRWVSKTAGDDWRWHIGNGGNCH